QVARYFSQAHLYLKGTSWLTSVVPLMMRLSAARTRLVSPLATLCMPAGPVAWVAEPAGASGWPMPGFSVVGWGCVIAGRGFGVAVCGRGAGVSFQSSIVESFAV